MMKTVQIISIVLVISIKTYPQKIVKSFELFDTVVKSFYDNKLFHGHVLIANKDSIIFQKGYGYADIENEIPFSSKTKIKIGSVSKQFTAHLILQLVDNGLIDLDDKISDYLDLPVLNQYGKVTIQQLLVMSSGISDYDIPQGSLREYHDALYYLNYLNNKPFLYDPGSSYNYSNPNYDILGLIVEKLTGLSLEAAYRKMIFDKVGMPDSGLDFIPDSISNKARSYKITPKGYERAFEEDLYLVRGCGSIYSTPKDLLAWDNSILSESILSSSTFRDYFIPYNQVGENTYYSYGWVVEFDENEENDTLRIVRHEGSAPIYFNCLNYIDLTNKYIVIIIDNTLYSLRREVLKQIKNLLYNRQAKFSKKSLYFETVDMIISLGFDKTVDHLLKIDLNNNPYQWGRYDIDYLKGYYKKQGKIKEYLELHRVCMYLYPEFKEFSDWAINNFKQQIKSSSDNGNLYACLGAYQLFSGDKMKAAINLKKSLNLGISKDYEYYIYTLIDECKD